MQSVNIDGVVDGMANVELKDEVSDFKMRLF